MVDCKLDVGTFWDLNEINWYSEAYTTEYVFIQAMH